MAGVTPRNPPEMVGLATRILRLDGFFRRKIHGGFALPVSSNGAGKSLNYGWRFLAGRIIGKMKNCMKLPCLIARICQKLGLNWFDVCMFDAYFEGNCQAFARLLGASPGIVVVA